MSKNVNFEQNIKELEDVVRKLESGEISLDELLTLFEKGVGLAKSANSQLDNAEQKINMLIANKSTGELEEVPIPEMNKEKPVGDAALSVPPAPEPPAVVEVAPPVAVEEPPKEKGAHFVSTVDDVPPMPENPPPADDVPPMSDADLQQAFMDIDDL